MFFIVGLGNPGREYERTRHNIGFMAVDFLASQYNASFAGSRSKSEVTGWITRNTEKIMLIKPLTFMNRSGEVVGSLLSYYRGEPRNLIVIHDDLDLPFGRMKLVVSRGSGGHNGIRSIIETIGSKEFIRIRLGIGRPQQSSMVSNYVLSSFSREEFSCLDPLLAQTEKAIRLILTRGANIAMTECNDFMIKSEDSPS